MESHRNIQAGSTEVADNEAERSWNSWLVHHITQCHLQAQKCKFCDTKETEERIIEQLIAGTASEDVKCELLNNDEKLTLDDGVKIAQFHEGAIHHLSKLKESVNPPATHHQQMDAIRLQKQSEWDRIRKCNKCGLHHQSKPKQQCPALRWTSAICQKKNHWAKICRLIKEEDLESRSSHQSDKNTHKYRGPKISLHVVVQDEEESSKDEQFGEISFRMIKMSKSRGCTWWSCSENQGPNSRQWETTCNLEVKVDTGVTSNILPPRIFSQMCPDKMASDEKPVAGMTRESKVVLSANANLQNYNTYSLQTSHTLRPLSPLVPIDTFRLIQITILDLERNQSF